MGTWRTPQQTTFLEGYVSTYFRRVGEGKAKDFWAEVTKEWFQRFALEAPSAESIEKEGSEKKAITTARVKRIKQIKRFFTNQTDAGSAGRRDLHLEDGKTRRLSEVQTYMTLFYDSRIRPTVLLRWAKDKATYPGSTTVPDLPEDGALAEGAVDGHIFKDMKVPISYKNSIAQELWDREDEVVKKQVRSRRESGPAFKTVYNTEGKERSKLVLEYSKNIPSLQRSMGTVLRNIDQKCAGKGIIWVGCPSPHAGGEPVGYFQCVGEAPGNRDFETFIGTEKAREFKALFGEWIQKIYPSSEWSMFSFDQTPDDPETGDQTDADKDKDNCGTLPDASTSAISGSPQYDVLFAGCGSSMVAEDAVAESQAIALDNAAAEPQTIGDSNVTAEPSVAAESRTIEDSNITIESAAVAESRTIEHDGPTFHSNATQDQPLSPTLLASFVSIQCPSLDAHTQSPPLATPTKPEQNDDAGGNDAAILPLPTNAQEPIWMKKKGTLAYFRSLLKVQGLSTLIPNWYRLEKASGFPEQKTQKGLPMKNRPKVIATFLKNGHSYKRDYGLEALSLGNDISTWWEDIKSTAHAGYCGTTGIYTLVVLMTWWSTFLGDQPNLERTRYLNIIEELNRAILTALQSAEKSSAGPSLLAAPSRLPPSERCPAKRAHDEEPSSRKRQKA